tara:strand:- start:1038 stop:1556 length:519 start_codon:yes stop_codon:yes gene_type:complete
MSNLKQLKQSDLKVIRELWYNELNGICPILGNEYPLSDFVVDHQHKLVKELSDETGKGLCRGAIQFQANALEGKISNAYRRYGLEKHIDLVSFLRNLADYLESNKIHTDEKLIHPNEAPRKPTLMKSSYNKLVKEIDGKQKVPEYKQKKGNLTKPLEVLFEKYNIKPEFKKL